MNKIKISLLGTGNIGRELINRIKLDPNFRIVSIADSTGLFLNENGFTVEDLDFLVFQKSSGKKFNEVDMENGVFNDNNQLINEKSDVIIDVTASQTYQTLIDALKSNHVITANKIPFADTKYSQFKDIFDVAEKYDKQIDIGPTVGAGLQLPNIIKFWPEGVNTLSGCLSGTMNYVSQRINEDTPLSSCILEAMNEPRKYSEPDPRIDLSGKDFARKFVILSRYINKPLELDEIQVDKILCREQIEASLNDFLECLPQFDVKYKDMVEDAKLKGKKMWYVGKADYIENDYSIGFREIDELDPIIRATESENSIKIHPKHWSRPITIIGPGAGIPETVSGLISGLYRLTGH